MRGRATPLPSAQAVSDRDGRPTLLPLVRAFVIVIVNGAAVAAVAVVVSAVVMVVVMVDPLSAVTSDVDEFEFVRLDREMRVHQHQQQRLRTHPVSVGLDGGWPKRALHSALLPTPVSGGGVWLQHAHSGAVPSENDHGVYGREETRMDAARGGRIAIANAMPPHMNTQLVTRITSLVMRREGVFRLVSAKLRLCSGFGLFVFFFFCDWFCYHHLSAFLFIYFLLALRDEVHTETRILSQQTRRSRRTRRSLLRVISVVVSDFQISSFCSSLRLFIL